MSTVLEFASKKEAVEKAISELGNPTLSEIQAWIQNHTNYTIGDNYSGALSTIRKNLGLKPPGANGSSVSAPRAKLPESKSKAECIRDGIVAIGGGWDKGPHRNKYQPLLEWLKENHPEWSGSSVNSSDIFRAKSLMRAASSESPSGTHVDDMVTLRLFMKRNGWDFTRLEMASDRLKELQV